MSTNLGHCRIEIGAYSSQRCGKPLEFVHGEGRSSRCCPIHGDERAALELQQQQRWTRGRHDWS